jgi:hypothetical protein
LRHIGEERLTEEGPSTVAEGLAGTRTKEQWMVLAVRLEGTGASWWSLGTR